MTPSPPVIATAPSSGFKSPQIMRIKVVLPDPLGPISATFAPSPTRNETSFSNTRPSESEYSTALTSMWPISFLLLRGEQQSSWRVPITLPHRDNRLYIGISHELEIPASR